LPDYSVRICEPNLRWNEAVRGGLFRGLSGAGKSTLEESAPERRLPADEPVGVAGDRLQGTAFRGDFAIGPTHRAYPLEAVFLLDRKGSRGIRPGSKAVARCCVLRAPAFALGYDARTTTFAGVESLIRKALP
jgi:hypothetical protein